MPGEGSMLHALISSRNNKRNRIDKLKRLENTSNESSDFVDHVQATPELLESIREKMLAERKLEQKKFVIKVTFFFDCTCYCSLCFQLQLEMDKRAYYFID